MPRHKVDQMSDSRPKRQGWHKGGGSRQSGANDRQGRVETVGNHGREVGCSLNRRAVLKQPDLHGTLIQSRWKKILPVSCWRGKLTIWQMEGVLHLKAGGAPGDVEGGFVC